MTRGMETFFDLPNMAEALRAQGVDPAAVPAQPADLAPDQPAAAPANNAAAPAPWSDPGGAVALRQHADHSAVMEGLCQELLEHGRSLMDLGFNVEPPRARGIFEVASSMYSNLITARTNQRDAELKAMKLALDQRKLDLEERKLQQQAGPTMPVEATAGAVVQEDRNALIRRLLDQRNSRAGA